MISTLFFDVGETILNAEAQQDALAEVHRKVLEDFGFSLTRDDYRRLDEEKIRAFVPSAMHAITWHFARPDVSLHNEITREIRSHYGEIRKLGSQLYPEVAGQLERLADGYSLGLAANAPASVTDILEDLGVLRWFSHTDVSGTTGNKKPDHRFLRPSLRMRTRKRPKRS